MEENRKLPLKRVELSLSKFNEVAIPHHLDLLRQYRANIIKYEQTGELGKVRTEQTHARRVTAQLRMLLRELEQLRAQVQEPDLVAFDKLTQKARDHTLKAIMDYLETTPMTMSGSYHKPNAEPAMVSCSAMSTDSVGLVAHQTPNEESDDGQALTQLQIEESLSEREAVLRGWEELQRDVRSLRAAWESVHAAARLQRESCSAAAVAVEGAAAHVSAGSAHIAAAAKLRTALYPIAGLAVGGALGGPVGLAVGIKAGALVAFLGGVLGYTGVSALIRKQRHSEGRESESETERVGEKENDKDK